MSTTSSPVPSLYIYIFFLLAQDKVHKMIVPVALEFPGSLIKNGNFAHTQISIA